MRDPRDLVAARAPVVPLPPEDTERRARAFARRILRRAGIEPLVPILAIAIGIVLPDPAMAQTTATQSPIRATALATARATILRSSARIEQGALRLAHDGSAIVLAPQPQHSTRPCDPAPGVAIPACRLIVYNLP